MNTPQYDPKSDIRPLSDDELSELDELLADLPSDGAFNIEALDGYCTALLLSPVPLASLSGDDWLPLVWGGDEAKDPFSSGKQRKRLVMAVLRHARHLDHVLHHSPKTWEPIYSIAESQGAEVIDAEDWCLGFLSAVDLAPEAWVKHFTAPEQREALKTIAALAGDDGHAGELTLQQRDALGRNLPDAVLALRALQTL